MSKIRATELIIITLPILTNIKNKVMSETKTFFVPESNGCDTATMMANQWNNPFMYLIWLALFRNGNGFGGNCGDANPQLRSIQDTLNTQQTNNLVMDAIKGNACAISGLASQLGCSTDQITGAINAVNNNITAMGYQNQLSNCQQTNNIERNFAATNYNMAQNCCDLKQSGKDNTSAIVAKLDAIEDSRKDREIAALTAQLASATARAERQAELAPIMHELNAIKSAQPNTVSVPYPQLTAVPTSALYGGVFSNNNGYWG